jgi:hydrogenase expression/formation protein HypD
VKYLSEYRNADLVGRAIDEIRDLVTRPWTLMEVCGGQTHSIIRYGLDRLLPEEIELVHGPGCPVCVTPLEMIDRALSIAARKDVIFASYGDMLRVPGSETDLFEVKSRGGDVRTVYSPLDAVRLAVENPDRTVVFFAIGFETTAPANGMAVMEAKRLGLGNFCILASHVTVPPAISAIMESPDTRVDGFLAAGHVCTVMGTTEYGPLSKRYGIPIVITGFEPVDVALGVLESVRMLESEEIAVRNAYARSVESTGNDPARRVIEEVFEVCDRKWRGMGTIPMSGYRIRETFREFDAEQRFEEVQEIQAEEPAECRSGEVLTGILKPDVCPAFGTLCTPANPLGATMVSSEGACAAYYRYGRVLS